MKLGDVYRNKETGALIQIDSFATYMGKFGAEGTVVFRQIIKTELGWGSCPSFNGFGCVQDIEKEYDLLIEAEDLEGLTWDQVYTYAQADFMGESL